MSKLKGTKGVKEVKAPKAEKQVSSCCKAEIRHSDDGYGNKKPFCNACLLNIAPKKRVKKEKEETNIEEEKLSRCCKEQRIVQLGKDENLYYVCRECGNAVDLFLTTSKTPFEISGKKEVQYVGITKGELTKEEIEELKWKAYEDSCIDELGEEGKQKLFNELHKATASRSPEKRVKKEKGEEYPEIKEELKLSSCCKAQEIVQLGKDDNLYYACRECGKAVDLFLTTSKIPFKIYGTTKEKMLIETEFIKKVVDKEMVKIKEDRAILDDIYDSSLKYTKSLPDKIETDGDLFKAAKKEILKKEKEMTKEDWDWEDQTRKEELKAFKAIEEAFSTSRPCPEDLKDYTPIKMSKRQFWFRMFMSCVLGGLIVMAFNKFQFNQCHDAIVSAINPLFLYK